MYLLLLLGVLGRVPSPPRSGWWIGGMVSEREGEVDLSEDGRVRREGGGEGG